VSGLYTVQQVARYLGKRHQDVVSLIEMDGLPAVLIPAAKRPVRKVPLHGLHRWLAERAVGGQFIAVDELACEMAACATEEPEHEGRIAA
jgi:hypothetical protein